MLKILTAATVTLLAASCSGAGAQPAPPPPVIGFITAAEQPVHAESAYVGRVVSPCVVNLVSRVTGYLMAQDFKDGDEVKRGQLLYVIEQPPYQAAVAQAQAALDQAEATARNARLSLGRAAALLRTPAGQQSTLDAAQAAALADAAQIESAQAQLDEARINLSYTEIRAPVDGRIGATTVNIGNVVGPATGTLATIVAEDPMYVSLAIPVVESLALRGDLAGLDLLVQLPDGHLYGETGRIDFVNNQITADTDTLTLRGSIANPILPGGGRGLTDGEFVTAILRERAAQPEIIIPRDAVITDQLGDYVLEITPQNKVVRRAVVQGAATNGSVQIISGVVPGDRVITDGLQHAQPGMTVNPQPASGG